jgi:hypothetical protein
MGNTEVVKEAYESYIKISREKNGDENTSPENIEFQELVKNALGNGAPNGTVTANGDDAALVGVKYIDFSTIRRAMVEDYYNKKLTLAASKGVTYLEAHQTDLTPEEQAQILSLLIKIYIDLDDLSTAEKFSLQAMTVVENGNSPEALCFIYNSCAALKLQQNNHEEAHRLLGIAADNSSLLPPELRLLTLSNIAMLLNDESPEKAKKYFEAVRRLSASLKFDDFAAELFK